MAQEKTGLPGLLRHPVRFLDLSHDLVFAKDQAVERGNDRIEMGNRFGMRQVKAMRHQFLGIEPREFGPPVDQGVPQGVRIPRCRVDLRPVARRKDDRFRKPRQPSQAEQALFEKFAGKSQAIAQGDRTCLVTCAQNDAVCTFLVFHRFFAKQARKFSRDNRPKTGLYIFVADIYCGVHA